MMGFLKIETRILILFSLLIVLVQLPIYYIGYAEISGTLLIGFLLLLIIVALLFGPIIGLYSSLLFIFIVGSYFYYITLGESVISLTFNHLPLPILLGYGFALIILVLIAGHTYNLTIEHGKEKRRLEEEMRQLVAVDVDTGFDNKHRMAMEVEAEMGRVNRYGGTFTLILLQLDFFDQFNRLYGEKEQKQLLRSIGEKIKATTRSTDLKFRYAPDRFALLLTSTDDSSIDIIYKKLAEVLKNHVLLTGKYVTLSFRIGHIVYSEQTDIKNYETLFSTVEGEMRTNEL